MSYPTTRTFARTTQEAFKDASYGEWFYPPEKSLATKVLFHVGVYLWIAIGIYFWVTA